MASTQTVNLGAYAARFRGRLGVFKRGVMLKLFSAVIFDTPVDTGRLRANWIFSTGEDTPQGDPNLFDKLGAQTVTAVTNGVQQNVTDKDGVVNIGNSMHYAHRIEYLGWSRVKAPQGMVRKNMTRISDILRKQAEQNK